MRSHAFPMEATAAWLASAVGNAATAEVCKDNIASAMLGAGGASLVC